MHPVILDAVIQVILDDRPPFDYTTLGFSQVPVGTDERTLMSMSLVHSSWTVPAQRALGRRIHVRGIEGIRAALSSPAVGAWTREVSFKWRSDAKTNVDVRGTGKCGHTPHTVLSELAWLLLRKAANVRLLSIVSCTSENEEPMRVFLKSLGFLAGLEGLWLVNAPVSEVRTVARPCGLLGELFATLPYLRRLRFLSVEGWSVGDSGYHNERNITSTEQWFPGTPGHSRKKRLSHHPLAFAKSPPASLKAVSLSFGDLASFPPCYSEWVFRPRGDYKLDAVSLRLRRRPLQPIEDTLGDVNNADLTSVHNNIFKWLTGIRTVHCRIDQHEIAYPIGAGHDRVLSFGDTLRRAVTCFGVVKDLRLQIIGSPLRRPMRELHIPQSVETLHIRFTRNRNSREHVTELFKGLDETLAIQLERRPLPRLRRLTITCDNGPKACRLREAILRSAAGLELLDLDESNGQLLPWTKVVCKMRNVEFVYTENPYLYHFFTME